MGVLLAAKRRDVNNNGLWRLNFSRSLLKYLHHLCTKALDGVTHVSQRLACKFHCVYRRVQQTDTSNYEISVKSTPFLNSNVKLSGFVFVCILGQSNLQCFAAIRVVIQLKG